jgi:hypothetical protein
MATSGFPKFAEQLSGLDRRQMLASAAAVATAIAAPNAVCATTVRIQAVERPGPSAGHFSGATIRRLREIAQRNEIRQEARLPLLSVAKELGRMKHQACAEAFRCFEAEHGRAVWEQVLKPRREAEGNPNWRPSWSEGVRLQSEVYKILRARFCRGAADLAK